jgi:hypothetical protein
MTRETNVGLGRDANYFKTRVRFRIDIRFGHIGSRSCQSPKSWPNAQDADDTEPSDEYALILGQILTRDVWGP